MRQFDVTILGSGAALPARGRYPSAQVLNASGALYLIDCAEGTQSRLRQYGISIQKIDHIFISHLHGDHYLGLMGVISTMHLMGREKPLNVHGPAGLQEIIDIQLKYSGTYLRYPLQINELGVTKDQIVEDERLTVESFPLKHRISCNGFLFREKENQRSMKKEYIDMFDLSFDQIRLLKSGLDITTIKGEQVKSDEATIAPMRVRSYAYCSDTAFLPGLAQDIHQCDLLYHEATFDDDLARRAKETFHSTARQAGRIAAQAEVGKLIIGHFSSRYKDLSNLLVQAQEEFSNTQLAIEGEVFNIG